MSRVEIMSPTRARIVMDSLLVKRHSRKRPDPRADRDGGTL